MARRHDSLIRFSRDHHDALLLAVRLRQGTAALLNQWTHDPHLQARIVAEFEERHLRRHFHVEETVLFPACVSLSAPLVDDLIADHRWMQHEVGEIAHEDIPALPSRLQEFGRRLELHVRREERELFPLIERGIPSEELAALGRAIEAAYRP